MSSCSPARCTLSVVFFFVCVNSLLLLQVLRRSVLEPSHPCFLPSNACGENDRLLDTCGYQQEGTPCKRISRAFGNPQWCLPRREALMCTQNESQSSQSSRPRAKHAKHPVCPGYFEYKQEALHQALKACCSTHGSLMFSTFFAREAECHALSA